MMDVRSDCDVMVIGAGPAGAVAAYLLAREGFHTLLVDAKRFPRNKVCGGCLNPRAVATLRSIGLEVALERCAPARIDRLQLFHEGRTIQFSLPPGFSVTRETFDASLTDAAERAGATFLPETRATVRPGIESERRRVRLLPQASSAAPVIVHPRVVLACDGLGHPSLQDLPEVRSVVARGSRIGLGAVLDAGTRAEWVPRGRICMAVAAEGYVGLARAESDRTSIAAAVDAKAVANAATPAELIQRILRKAGIIDNSLDDAQVFRGTPPITQRALDVAAERLFLVGDAASYVEPFTGEGMAAAIEGAVAVAAYAKRAIGSWQPDLIAAWQREYERRIRSRQTACRVIAWLARHPRTLRCGLSCLERRPQLGSAVGRWIGSESTLLGTPTL